MPAVDEALLCWAWEHRALREPWVTLEDGRRLRVIFPGRRWGGPGPDFRGAVVELADGSLWRGDVEVHVRGADWFRHGHHRDRAFERVVLHLVRNEGRARALRRDGEAIPVLPLATQLSEPVDLLRARMERGEQLRIQGAPCARTASQAIVLLEAAGRERFLARSRVLEGDLEVAEPEQTLYRALLDVMGYSANRDACRQLADTITYWELAGELIQIPAPRRRWAAQALLLGRAGLLPSEPGMMPVELRAEWAQMSWHAAERMPADAWLRRAARPDNSPARRLAGLAIWMSERVGGDWIGELEQAVRDAARGGSTSTLASLLVVRASDTFWPGHFDFGWLAARARPTLIGRGRSLEALVNAALPFLHALGERRGDQVLVAAALLCAQRLPSPPQNRVTRAMISQVAGGLAGRIHSSASRHQGLMHLYRQWCDERRCESCPAGGSRGGAVVHWPTTLPLERDHDPGQPELASSPQRLSQLP